MALVHKHVDLVLNYNNKKILDKDNSYLKFLLLKGFLKKWPYEESDEEKKNVQQISEKEFEDLKKRLKDPPFHKDKWKPININGEKFYQRSYPVLGEYDPIKKEIIMYIKNIEKRIEDGTDVKYSELFNIVLLHEMFHAYFHYVTERGKCSYNYIFEIEEAMAEFCSLVCLEDLSFKDYKGEDVFDFAKKNIEEKQNEVGELAAYGFGAYLFDKLKLNEKRYELINNYIQKLGNIDEDDEDVKEYCKKVRLSKYVPDSDNQKDCMELLIKILDPNNDVMTSKKDVAEQQPEEKSLPPGTTQIEIFSHMTIASSFLREWVKNPKTIYDLEQEVNDFLVENEGKIAVKDIKYTTQCMTNKQNETNPDTILWTVMIIYETK